MRKLVVGVTAALVGLVLTAVAYAGSSSALIQQYGGLGGETQHTVGAVGVLGTATPPGGTLPFTGLDLALIALAALALMFTGWALRRAAHKRS